MHKLLPEIQESIKIPFLHIAEATVKEIKSKNIKKVGLLGTKFTMEESFYKNILINSGIDVITPNRNDRDLIHKIIYNELCLGLSKSSSKKVFIDIINKMENIEGVILGCTEIGI